MITLGLRVLLLSAICVILPLFACLAVLWKELKLQERRELLEALSHLGDAQKKMADLIFTESLLQVRSARLFAAQTMDKALLRQDFQDLLARYPDRTLSIAAANVIKGKLIIDFSSQASLEGAAIPYEEPIYLPLQPFFFYFSQYEEHRIAVIGTDLDENQKLVLVLPAAELVKISPSISEWAGTMGIALLQDTRLLTQNNAVCPVNSCQVIRDIDLTRILNGEIETPLFDKSRLAEVLQLDTVPLSVRVDIEPILYETHARQLLNYLAIILLFTGILGAIVTAILTGYMVRPFNSFARLMLKAGSGDLAVRYPQQFLAFEINVLGSQFNHMLEMMARAFEQAKREYAEREKILHECRLGHNIQRSLFPRLLPRLPHLDIAASFSPASDVSGDYYDLFLHDSPQGKRLMITIADASGKGVAASLFAFQLRSMLRSFMAAGESLENIITHANQLFCLDTEEGGMFVTAWVGILHLADNQLQYASLGHYPAMWKTGEGEVKELETRGSAFGMAFVGSPPIFTLQLHPKELLFLYTDGWIETRRLGITINRQHLLEWLGKLPVDMTSEQIMAALETSEFAKDATSVDDRTALVIRLL